MNTTIDDLIVFHIREWEELGEYIAERLPDYSTVVVKPTEYKCVGKFEKYDLFVKKPEYRK